MSELDDFLSAILATQVAAESAIHEGDASPRLALWSPHDPVTLFGAFGANKHGWHSSVSLDGAPSVPRTLRVTHVYRREYGEWKIVHRHGDVPPPDESPPAGHLV